MTRLSKKHAKKLGLEVTAENKYNNKKPKVDGITFDSQKEADYYCNLKLLKEAGKIIDFELQPKFRLLEPFEDRNGNHHRPIDYYADFKVWWLDGTVEIVDVKGYKTNVYKIKKKLLLAKYPEINFTEVE